MCRLPAEEMLDGSSCDSDYGSSPNSKEDISVAPTSVPTPEKCSGSGASALPPRKNCTSLSAITE